MNLAGRSHSPREGSDRGVCSPADGEAMSLSSDEWVHRILDEAIGSPEEAFQYPFAKGA